MGKDTLILLSGGMDSATVLYMLREKIKMAVNFYYGGKLNDRERECARQLCQLNGIPLKEIDISAIFTDSNCSLLQHGAEVPQEEYKEDMNTVVPFRNGVMLSILASIAEAQKCQYIAIGTHKGDWKTYPDCRPEFNRNIAEAIYWGTSNAVEIRYPLQTKTKREIGEMGKYFGLPFEKTYSCYNGREKHCGLCPSCLSRKEALIGFDTTEYEA